ncbi:MAG: amidohydrolase [SAR324 cluster bacterium]|nr:amidohydrolase [SAR324 cluster bacterium]
MIDAHTHIVPEKFPDFSRRKNGIRWPQMDPVDACSARVMISGKNFRTVRDNSWSVQRRTEEMDTEGVHRQVLSPMPKLYSYDCHAPDALDFCRYVNESIANMVQAQPDRFFGLGIVPLQDADLAARAIEEICALGLRGVEIGTNVNGRSLGEPEFLPFFKEASRQKIAIFVHAQDPTNSERFTGAHLLENLIGFPQENTLAAATLITGGTMEHCPHARFLFSHGGGGFNTVLARLEQGYDTMEQFLPQRPRQYISNFFFDSLQYDAGAIRHLLASFGSHRVVLGTDYPFAIREQPPGKYLNELQELSKAERERVQYKNCLEFLGLSEN